MRMLRWAFVAGAALLVGLGFAVLSENLVLAVIPVASILVLAGYFSLERRVLGPPTPGRRRRRTVIGGSSAGDDCGFGGIAAASAEMEVEAAVADGGALHTALA